MRTPVLSSRAFKLFPRRCYSSDIISKKNTFDIASADETPRYVEIITDEDKEAIVKKRMISRLNPSHENILNGVRPYSEDMEWFHKTIRYKQRMLGRYGMKAMREQIGAIWPTQEEIEDKILFEKTGYPKTIQEMWQEIEERNKQKEEKSRLREERLTANLAMVGKWEKQLMAKIAKKEAELQLAKERKARLMDEVRKQFGFAIDPRDERFKEMLELKEKEDKKRKKEAKKQERASKYITAMLEKAKTDNTSVSASQNEPEQAQKEPENKS